VVLAEPVCFESSSRPLSPILIWYLLCTGRTTFVNTLCGKKVLESKDADDAASAHIEEGVRIKPVTVGKLPSLLTQKEKRR
jgi:cell division control protein 11